MLINLIQGIPSDGKFRNGQQLTELLTNIIYICTAGHAAVTFTQYDEYGFVPSYPGCLRGTPPKDKVILSVAFKNRCHKVNMW